MVMKNVFIFGDSYSTFQGYVPNEYPVYYPNLDVERVEDTWWAKVIATLGGRLVQNNSYSGSTIGYTGYNNSDCSQSSSFIYRFRELKNNGFFETNKIDTMFVFGGTNDSWSDAPLGEMQFSGWEEKDLFQVFPAFCHFVYAVKSALPNTEIVVIINTVIKEEVQEALEQVAKYYGVKYVRLKDIDNPGHPTAKGMKQISEQVLSIWK